MIETTSHSAADRAARPRALAATVALWMAVIFVSWLVLLHVVRADLDPSWHMVSEYAIGRFGWMNTAAFLSLAGGFFSLMVALRPVARGTLGVTGLVFLTVAGFGAAMGGLFATDPPGTAPEHISRTGMLHGLSFMLGVPSTLFAVTCLNARLWQDTSWRDARPLLLASAGFVWLTMLVFAASMITYLSRGATGSEFIVGWQNRAVVLAWALWIAGVSSRLRQSREVALA